MLSPSHYEPPGGRARACVFMQICARLKCCNESKSDRVKTCFCPPAEPRSLQQPCVWYVCVHVQPEHTGECLERRERDKHVQAAIMGNFPTAAKLKPLKTKQRRRMYALILSADGGWDASTTLPFRDGCVMFVQLMLQGGKEASLYLSFRRRRVCYATAIPNDLN